MFSTTIRSHVHAIARTSPALTAALALAAAVVLAGLVAVTRPALALGAPAAAQTAADLTALQDQAVERLREYIRIDTINPPGNEIRGAEFFARIFAAEAEFGSRHHRSRFPGPLGCPLTGRSLSNN